MIFDTISHDIRPYLERKYAIAQQGADAQTSNANTAAMSAQTDRMALPSENRLREATANYTDVQGRYLPLTAVSGASRDFAGAREASANAAFTDYRRTDFSDELKALFGITSGLVANDGRTGARAGGVQPNVPTQPPRYSAPPYAGDLYDPRNPTNMTSLTPEELTRRVRGPGYAKGTARVPGKGAPTKDTVKARLAPNEAVLNAAAADLLGRGFIERLNQIGAHKLGI